MNMTGHSPPPGPRRRGNKNILFIQMAAILPSHTPCPSPFLTVSRVMHLLLLDTAAVVLLRALDRGFVALGLALGHEATSILEGAREVTSSGLAEDVDLDQVGLEGALQGDDGLDEERVGVLHVQVHHRHHADTHQLATDQLAQLPLVVVHVGGSDRLGLLAGTHGGRLNVLERSHVCNHSYKGVSQSVALGISQSPRIILTSGTWDQTCATFRGDHDRTRSSTYPSWH